MRALRDVGATETSLSQKTDQATKFVPELESLRGFAAVSVALFHSAHVVPIDNVDRVYQQTIWHLPSIKIAIMRLILAIFSGGPPVSLFFVLSGFVLMCSLKRSRRGVAETSSAFVLRRLFRLFPALIVNLVIMAFIFGSSWRALLLNILTLDTGVNGASWTLSVETLVVPFILAVFFLHRKLGAIALICCLFVALKVNSIGDGYYAHSFFLFLFGMILAERRPKLEASRTVVFALVALAASARLLLGYWSSEAIVIEGLASYYLVAAFAFGQPQQSHLFLRRNGPRFLGRISYSFYLYHPLFLGLIAPLILDLHCDPFVSAFLIASSTIALTLPLSWLSYTLVEVRCGKYGEKILGARMAKKPSVDAPAATYAPMTFGSR